MELDRARRLAQELMRAHGLVGWTFAFDRASTRAGMCRFTDRRISLSRPVTLQLDEAHVRDTVLHEIAHALVGPRHAHDAVWKATAQRIGATPRARMREPIQVARPWIGRCPAGHEMRRQRRPSAPMSCTTCHPVFTAAALFEWRHASGVPARMTSRYEAALARLRREASTAGSLRMLPAGRSGPADGPAVARRAGGAGCA
ncbi:SprT-like domain-containing protein [Cellulomonas marina]|uniref:SprT-like family protein n=1 Tax=Cellulomonas marina TaxID=988821 RepID=A0A1I0V364_9CELL|nr:SprT-like domain-containing protein [Cellulomonas marina]GIG28286.1 hypothetical protein Cma02nite_08860 [Cellulomonas marina]SFA70520.1 SprT-like family protein [Cellulomonas marina]